jgi:hypothetical protein
MCGLENIIEDDNTKAIERTLWSYNSSDFKVLSLVVEKMMVLMIV